MQWVCDLCGYIHNDDEPPDYCLDCGAPASNFSEWEEDDDDAASKLDDDIDDDDIDADLDVDDNIDDDADNFKDDEFDDAVFN